MIGFKILEEIVIQNYSAELSIEDTSLIIEAFSKQQDISTTRHQLGLNKLVVQAAYKDIEQVADTVYNLMNEMSIIEFATYDKDNNELTPNVYNTKPATLEELKEQTWFLISRDFDKKVASTYTIQNIQDLQSKVELVVDKTLKYSKLDGNGTWEFFKTKF